MTERKKIMVMILLADGFEELEALAPLDVLRRLEVETVLVGVSGKTVRGAHGVELTAERTLNQLKNETPDMVVLPGGMPGAANLEANPMVKALIKRTAEAGKYLAAICAAPMVLGKAGLLRGKRACCYPGFECDLEGAEVCRDARVVTDGNIITARGPGAAAEFAFELGRIMKDEVSAAFVKRSMQY